MDCAPRQVAADNGPDETRKLVMTIRFVWMVFCMVFQLWKTPKKPLKGIENLWKKQPVLVSEWEGGAINGRQGAAGGRENWPGGGWKWSENFDILIPGGIASLYDSIGKKGTIVMIEEEREGRENIALSGSFQAGSNLWLAEKVQTILRNYWNSVTETGLR